jgi:hypothetical protein
LCDETTKLISLFGYPELFQKMDNLLKFKEEEKKFLYKEPIKDPKMSLIAKGNIIGDCLS